MTSDLIPVARHIGGFASTLYGFGFGFATRSSLGASDSGAEFRNSPLTLASWANPTFLSRTPTSTPITLRANNFNFSFDLDFYVDFDIRFRFLRRLAVAQCPKLPSIATTQGCPKGILVSLNCRALKMSSRSFKSASYFASAAAQQKGPRSPRPPFVRTTSTSAPTSSMASTKGDDAFLSSFRSLNTGGDIKEAAVVGDRKTVGGGGASSRRDPSGDNSPPGPQLKPEASPSRKRSTPIAIELPHRSAPIAYTPLTGRGDLIGGYFPDHDEGSFKPHPFGPHQRSGTSTPGSPSNMSASSSHSSPGSDITPRGPPTVLTPIVSNNSPTFPTTDALGIPLGKYYPSNYMPPVTAAASTSRMPTSAPPTYLSIPQVASSRNKKTPGHERHNSDIKRKLQQYQRDMIAQARVASASTASHALTVPKPVGPRLAPCGSPGPITPLELEESDSYLAAGARARGNGSIGTELEKQRQLAQAAVGIENQRPRTADALGILN
ncbi:uncharacterized protein BP5553_01432 [Venustampulla echinocandica]|uniref:Uncharacterized protein n=1 Tax=Venustampulla echinocandica TaxID=2656787 RepID=A0A370U125_9HELO|nr:uncharacterized protein BP5553_01432 [Venustampulla echinocandica]RDL41453.1 hypothetical protein BP5553_01432 [Venustampulla echinocandica]